MISRIGISPGFSEPGVCCNRKYIGQKNDGLCNSKFQCRRDHSPQNVFFNLIAVTKKMKRDVKALY